MPRRELVVLARAERPHHPAFFVLEHVTTANVAWAHRTIELEFMVTPRAEDYAAAGFSREQTKIAPSSASAAECSSIGCKEYGVNA